MTGHDTQSSSTSRLFVAIELPDYVTAAIGRLQEEAGRIKGVSWVAPEKLHVTLAFLGDVEPGRQDEILGRLDEAKVRPFFLALEGLGVFPKKERPQVVWAGMAPVDPRLFQLHGKVERILMDLGFDPGKRRFHPHVTLARCQAGAAAGVSALLKKDADFGSAPFRVEEFSLFASELNPQGSIYRKLLTVRFE